MISRVCWPIIGPGKWLNAGVSESLNGAFLDLVRAQGGVFDWAVHFAMA